MTSASSRGDGLFRKIIWVLAGYLAAFALASLAVAVRFVTTSGPDAQASSGMYAFGDALLFVAVFGIVGLLPTGLGLIFLRPYRPFWLILSTLGAVIAITAVIALVLFAIGRSATAPSSLSTWADLAVLRMLPAPLFAAVLLVAALVSQHRASRWTLLAASGIELIVSAYAWFVWLSSFLRH